MTSHALVALMREVVSRWQSDRALSHGAALAYYALFSIAPLLVLVIAVAGLLLGREAAQGEIVARVQDLMGVDGGKAIESMILQASRPASGIVATVVSLATILLGATGAFGELQGSLNQIFRTTPPPGAGWRWVMRQRLSSFAMILGIGVLLWLSLLASAVLTAVSEVLARHVPLTSRVLPFLHFALTLLVITALFALIFKVLPDVRLWWRDVWLGAAFTSLLFTVGKTLIGWYLGRAGTTSVYGAAGSLVLVLLWIYYSAQILFLGAEFTEVYSRHYGSRRERT